MHCLVYLTRAALSHLAAPLSHAQLLVEAVLEAARILEARNRIHKPLRMFLHRVWLSKADKYVMETFPKR
jgi:hypothetical protein